MRSIITPEGFFAYERQSGYCIFTPNLRSKRWTKPLYAQIALTEKCNRHCWFCYASSTPNKYAEWPPGKFKQLIDFLDSWGLLGISLGGGEPFLYPHLREIVNYTWKKTGLDVTLTTSGSASEGQIAEVENCVSEVRISVRSLGDLENLKKFLSRKFQVGVNLLLFKGGVRMLELLIEGALALDVKDFMINSFLALGRGVAYKRREPNEVDYAQLAKLIRKFRGRAAFKVSAQVATKLRKHVNFKFLPFACEAKGRIIAITADGKVKPTSLSANAYPFSNPEEIPKIYMRIAL
jgi:MoaA/NifB/PqqE/SkfB family radical SAM enzyme